MSSHTLEQTILTTCKVLTAMLNQAIRQRLVSGRSLIMDLGPGLPVYRFAGPPAEEPRGITPEHLAKSRTLRKVTTFAQLLRDPITVALQTVGLLKRSAAASPLLAVSACGVAAWLMEQLHVSDTAISDCNRRPPELKSLLRECASMTTEVGPMASASVAKTIEAFHGQLALRAEKQNEGLAVLRFCGRGRGSIIWTEGLTQTGDSAFMMSLQDFVISFLAPALECMLERTNRDQPMWERRQQEGMRIFREISPNLAGTVQSALQETRPVGIRLGTGRTPKGLALDVWLHVRPGGSVGPGDGGCVLSVNRSHRDFVLEAASGERFYFPPALLSARLNFVNLLPHAMHPVIRQPAGGYNWCHPYSGPLGTDLFAGAQPLHGEGSILHAPSEQAVALFPQLQERVQTAMENNLCLKGQENTMRSIQQKLHSALASSREPDVLAAVTALHDIARFGLTCGHQNNRNGPRVRLERGSMPYPLLGQKISGLLAKRIFAFSTSTPSKIQGASMSWSIEAPARSRERRHRSWTS